MTKQLMQEMMKVQAELARLMEKKVIEKGDDEKKNSLQNFLSAQLLLNAPELLESWMVLKMEYEPFVMGLASILDRAGQVIEMKRAMQQAAQKPEAAPEVK